VRGPDNSFLWSSYRTLSDLPEMGGSLDAEGKGYVRFLWNRSWAIRYHTL